MNGRVHQKQESPLISVMISVYNSGRTLDRCIRSIVEQTYRNWELILIDSSSKDRTPELAKKWIKALGKDRCSYYNIAKRGHPAKRNFGIRRARGELLFFHDSDQYLPPTTFEECLKLIEEGNDGVDIPQVPDFEGKSYFSKCNILSIELFIFNEDIGAPNMVKAEHAYLQYQDEDLEWVHDSITISRFKERGLKIALIHLPLIHDRDIPMQSLVLKTRFIVMASKKQSNDKTIHIEAKTLSAFITRMLWVMKSQPKYLPGILLAFLVRIIARAITLIMM